MKHVSRDGTECWQWTGATDPKGYGRFTVNNRARLAHRVVYQEIRGPIPDGMDLDHLCRHPGCVNPDHLEPVTRGENIRRGVAGQILANRNSQRKMTTHCIHGHALIGDNLIFQAKGARACRTCKRANARRRHAARQDTATQIRKGA